MEEKMDQSNKINKVRRLSADIRKDVIQMIGCNGHLGHLGGSCSCADIIAALYGSKLRHDPKNPQWEQRDKFLCSKGHAAIAQYAALAETGYFPKEELWTVKNLGSRLQGHPDSTKTPGIEAGTGSLGQGLSIANGLALAMNLDRKHNKVYCLMGDGEQAEGQIWEAAMAAAHYRLNNVVGIIDRNRLQAMGIISDRLNSNPLPEKWASFGWHVIQINGHDIEQILTALDVADNIADRPVVIIADTVKGKGISFAENVVSFHNNSLSKEQYQQAMYELESWRQKSEK
jgi:transketolase